MSGHTGTNGGARARERFIDVKRGTRYSFRLIGEEATDELQRSRFRNAIKRLNADPKFRVVSAMHTPKGGGGTITIETLRPNSPILVFALIATLATAVGGAGLQIVDRIVERVTTPASTGFGLAGILPTLVIGGLLAFVAVRVLRR